MGQELDFRTEVLVDHRNAAGERWRGGRWTPPGAWHIVLLGWLLSGCAPDPAPGEAHSAPAADFGDARVVENAPPPVGPRWTVDSLPLWAIGQGEGDSIAIFSRITGVLPVGQGGFAVLDATPASIRVYDAGGALMEVLGGRGEGPGRLELPATLLWGGGDTLVVHDVALRRRVWFHPGSGFLKEERLEPGGRSVVGRLSTGEQVIRQEEELPRPLPTGVLQRSVVFRLEDGTGGGVELGRFRTVPLMVHGPGAGGTPEVTPLPFHVAPMALPWNGGVVVADGTADLREYDTTGRLVRVIRTGIPQQPLMGAWAEDFVRSRTGGIPDPEVRARVQADLSAAPLPDQAPVFSNLQVDSSGNLWLLAARLPGEPAVQRWWVVDPDGTTLGSVGMPPRVSLRIPGEEVVLGSVADDEGVIRIVRHRLRK